MTNLDTTSWTVYQVHRTKYSNADAGDAAGDDVDDVGADVEFDYDGHYQVFGLGLVLVDKL